MQSNIEERLTKELEGWVVGIDTKNSVINVEHFPSHSHTCMRENNGASRSLGPSAAVDERPLRFAFKVPPSRLLQTKVGCRVIVERTKRRSEIAGGGDEPRPNTVVDGASSFCGGSDSFRLVIPQPKREREQRGVIERIVHKGMCVVAVKGLLNTVAQRHNEKGSGERREEEQVCLLWTAVEKDAEQMAIISTKFGADRVKRDMFLSTGALCENKEGKEREGSDDATNVFLGLPVVFSLHSGTSVVKTVRFLFDQPFCEGQLSANANSKDEMVVGKKSTKGVSWVDDDNDNNEVESSNVLVDEPPAKKAVVDNTDKETPVVAADHISKIKDQPNLSRGGTKLNAGNNRALQRATSASDTPPPLPSDSSSNASLIGTAISATLAQQSGSPSSPNTVPSVALMGSWEVSSALFSTIAADLASAARTRQHMHQQQQQSNNAPLPSNPVVAVQCLYQQMALENHTPPLVSQESDLKIGIGLGIIAYAEQAAAEIAKRKKEEEEEGSHVVTSLSPSASSSSSSSARVAISILDDDGEDVTECVCVITPAAGGDSVYEYFNISVLPFEMEGSCCEVRIKISVFVVDDHDDDDDGTEANDVREKEEDDSSSGKASPIVELTSRPFFVRPSVASLAARRNKFYRSSTAEDLASSSALLAVSPYSQDSCSSKFWTRDYLTPTDRIENGFIDPGRSNPLLDPDALIHRGRENDGGEGKDRHKGRGGGGFGLLDASTSSALLSTMREREVLLIDEGKDKTLRGWVERSQQMLSLVMDTKAKVLSLAWFVIAVYGGTNVTDDVFDASMSRIRFGRDTRRSSSGRSATSARGGASSATLRGGGGAGSLTSGVMKQSANTLCLGSIPIGLCRHRALLFKYLCDKNNLMCYLVRGTFAESAAQAAASPTTQSSTTDDTKTSSNNTNGGETSRHSWCVVLTGGCGLGDTIGGREMLLIDCTHPSEPVRPWPQLGYACSELPPHAEPVRTSDLCGQNGGADQADSHEKTASMEIATTKRNECMYHCFFAASAKEQVPILQEEVGRGAVAVVHRATFGGLSCALKVPHCATDEEDLRREYAILSLFRTSSSSSLSSNNKENADGDGQKEGKELHHQRNNGIVQCLGWCGGLLLEYMPFSLLGFMNSLLLRRMALRAAQIREVLTAVTRALALVHSKGYVHRDVKTENILLYPERCEDCMRTGVVCPRCSLVAKLADFADCCKLPSQPNPSSAGGGGGGPTSPVLVGPLPVVGTAPYAAPEIEAEVPFGAAADIWSLGILAVELFLMRMPMPNTSGVSGKFAISPYLAEPSTQKKKKSSEKNAPPSNAVFVPSLELKTAPVWGVSFVEGCLKVRMEERLSCEALLKILESAR